MSLWDLTLKGGPVMIPIAICSIIAFYIIIERFIAIRKINPDPSSFMNTIKEYLKSNNLEGAKALCSSTVTSIARIIGKGLTKFGKPAGDIEKTMENTASVEIASMERGLSALATCASAAPMLGILGTVTGLVRAFYDMKTEYDRTHANIDIGVLSQGMYEAMITTVAGLIIGIIALICYNILSAMIKKAAHNLEVHSNEFIDIIHS
ncbi:MAG: MotA/TolQ/ExbB proton channel family protein [Bacteroidetes bacterium]|nr:MotA/TolQ/ExbB proton channel family protein [Bacteroidota bacterium]